MNGGKRVASARLGRAALAVALDVAIFAAGVLVALVSLQQWLGEEHVLDPTGVAAVGLVFIMSRFPLTLTHQSGDIVIGFETCVLVYLVLTVSPWHALALWSVATALAMLTQRKSWRARIFNVGLTILGGALFVLIVAATDPGVGNPAGQLASVMLACAVYFTFDLIITAVSIAIEDGCSINAVLRWGSVPLGLACFVSVDTLGFLAAVLTRNQPLWTLVLLLVPIAAILVAVRSVSENRLAQRRLQGLLEAATQAPDWLTDEQIAQSLVQQAERTLRSTTAALREEPPSSEEIGAPITLEDGSVRHLVVRAQSSGREFTEQDRNALETLTAVGTSAFQRRRLSDETTYLARHDALTGLHNRAVFADRLTAALEAQHPSGLLAVLYCDLDGFKGVNDRLGHRVGDDLLLLVAHRILGCLRPGDVAARLGGDEFGVLLDDLTDESQAVLIAERLTAALEAPFDTAGQELLVQVSIGVAFSGLGPTTASDMINNADTAMYAAKARGKGTVARFEPSMRSAEIDRLELEDSLRHAVRDGLITVQFQPVVDLSSGLIDGFEALARWTHPTLGSIGPDRFIAAAERTGLIRQLGLQILERAHEGGRLIAERAGRPMALGVNLSPVQVTDESLAQRVRELRDLDPQVPMVLELTEGMLLGNDLPTVAALTQLKQGGVRLAIDDFGIGYSSVGYLHRLPVDVLKIDKMFVSELHDERSRALVAGVVAMAHAMNLSVIAEGVEDWDSADAVRDLGCDFAQGYLFSRPLPLADAAELAAVGSFDMAGARSTSPASPSRV
ncbi:MAG: putative bifunctional diguanylate cyclase/phosphodiesterase [Candidatus Nanopelagicales bacterium]